MQYFFDPSLLLPTSKLGDSSSSLSSGVNKQATKKNVNDPQFFDSKYLFMPCTIIKSLDDDHGPNSSKSNNNKNNSAILAQPYAGPTLVKTEDGTLHKIVDSSQLIALHSPDDYTGMDDVLHLPKISEASLLHTLRIRYTRDDVYTQAGQILISINPYKNLTLRDSSNGESIYSENRMMLYRTYRTSSKIQSPHLFQIADRAYTALMDSVHASSDVNHLEDEDAVMITEHPRRPGAILDQSIIISGESGAGKTEATKIIMQFLARITRTKGNPKKGAIQSATESFTETNENEDPLQSATSLEDRVLSCNPLLETFGNAQTLRNNNSSRFGKFIRIDFSTDTGSITGASIANYLLEKTRITTQVEGERNYHIFYQLFAGAGQSLLERLGLHVGVSAFKYLGNRQQAIDQKVNESDARSFVETQLCLKSLGLSEAEQDGVFAISAGVLHLGNIEFEENVEHASQSEGAKIKESSIPSLQKACELLGLNESELTEAILTKTINVNGKIIKKTQNVGLAEDKRDALAKMTYSSLFIWLVKCVNDRLTESSSPSPGSPTKYATGGSGFIGVLDIYGFECFDTNGFEQLLINYCNEKLQRHFNRHLFEVEQELYANEGVDWSYISFNDNRPCLELIEGGGGGGVGVLNTLDDAWGGMGTSSEKDGKFVAQLHKMFGSSAGVDVSSKKGSGKASSHDASTGHPNFKTPKFGSDRQFVVVHYAGGVRYTADGFVEKNMETLSNELRDLGENATAEIPKRVYTLTNEGSNSTSQRSSIRGISVSSQFRTSLQALVTELENTQPHYIRCIKPNLDKSPSRFNSGEVLKQLRYSGMMEAIRIRQEGYALREDHTTFFERFSVLLNSDEIDGDGAGILQLVKALSKRLNVSDADWQVGHSKIFLRRELAEKLERLAKLRVLCAARTVCIFARRVVRKRLSKFLITWVRFRILMLKKKRIRNAAAKISSSFRRFQQRRIYKNSRVGFVLIQAHVRRNLATRRVKKIRDPFCDMTFRECKQLLANMQEKLDKTAKEKDFRRAALLEGKM